FRKTWSTLLVGRSGSRAHRKRLRDWLKKSPACLNVRRTRGDQWLWERKSLPVAIFGASAHPPQAPIWLDPSGCPPGRVFYFRRPKCRFCRVSRTKSPRITTAYRHVAGAPLDKPNFFHKIISSQFSDSSVLVCVSLPCLFGMFMTIRTDVARGRDLLARWCALAEDRLDYLTEMFESGRWRR